MGVPSSSLGRLTTLAKQKVIIIFLTQQGGAYELREMRDKQEVIGMCDTCGCTPCKKCGKPIKNGVCVGCKKKADECVCKK